MRHAPATLGGVALLALLTFAGSTRADVINWSYSWSRTPTDVMADSPGTGYVSLTAESLQNATGNSDIVATNIQSHSTASPSSPDKFTNAPYSLSLYLVDQASGDAGTLNFTGVLNGTLSALNSNIKNTFNNPVVQAIVLGANKYTVTMNSFVPPGPPGSSTSGSIGAHATVKVEKIVIQDAPEPSTFVLAVLSLPLVGGMAWRRRRSVC